MVGKIRGVGSQRGHSGLSSDFLSPSMSAPEKEMATHSSILA